MLILFTMAEFMTEEEVQLLVGHFKTMKIKPKMDTLHDFETWMSEHAKVKDEKPDSKDHVETVYPTSAMQHFPKITHFSGNGKKDSTTYDVWRSEVECIIKEGHPTHAIAQAIRSSLKGEALRVRSRLPAAASIGQILAKMDSVYGVVEQSEMLLANFYSAKQQPDEDVSTWSCRVEDLLSKACDNNPIDGDAKVDSMLRTVLWSGLAPKLKDATGHLYERLQDFDQLRVAIRRVEQDHAARKSDDKEAKKQTAQSKSAVGAAATSKSEMDEIKGMIQQLVSDVGALKMKPAKEQNKYQQHQRRGQGNRYQQQSSGQQSGNGQGYSYSTPPQPPSGEEDLFNEGEEPTCWRCGQVGHIALGCRSKLGNGQHLNANRPAWRGKR